MSFGVRKLERIGLWLNLWTSLLLQMTFQFFPMDLEKQGESKKGFGKFFKAYDFLDLFRDFEWLLGLGKILFFLDSLASFFKKKFFNHYQWSELSEGGRVFWLDEFEITLINRGAFEFIQSKWPQLTRKCSFSSDTCHQFE